MRRWWMDGTDTKERKELKNHDHITQLQRTQDAQEQELKQRHQEPFFFF